jgi:hypothetical protein
VIDANHSRFTLTGATKLDLSGPEAITEIEATPDMPKLGLTHSNDRPPPRGMGPGSIIAIAIIAGLLASCVSQRAQREKQLAALNARASEMAAACPHSPPAKSVDRARCLNEALALLRPTFPYPDLADVLMATRMDIAARADRKEITREQAELEMAKATSTAIGEEQRRSLAGRSVLAQEQSADAASASASAQQDTANAFSRAAFGPIVCARRDNLGRCY